MHHPTSEQEMGAICRALVSRVDQRSAADGLLSPPPAPEQRTESAEGELLASLVTRFLHTLAAATPSDLGEAWLLQRLHHLLVEHQSPCPGEAELLRADIRARAQRSGLAATEWELLAQRIEETLMRNRPTARFQDAIAESEDPWARSSEFRSIERTR